MNAYELKISLPDDVAATERWGERVGRGLAAGQTVALSGPLGAGKTTFVRGLARGLGVDDPDGVSSPTYLLVVEHAGAPPLMHADAYLPEKLAAFLEDGGLEYLLDADKVVCVEWAENVGNMLPNNALWVFLDHVADGGRELVLRTSSPQDYPATVEWSRNHGSD